MVARTIFSVVAAALVGAAYGQSGHGQSGSGSGSGTVAPTGQPTSAPTAIDDKKPQLRNVGGNLVLQVHESKDIGYRVGEGRVVSLSNMLDEIAITEDLVLGSPVTAGDENRSTVGQLTTKMGANYAADTIVIAEALAELTNTTSALGDAMTSGVMSAYDNLVKQMAKAILLQATGSIFKVKSIGGCVTNAADASKYDCQPGSMGTTTVDAMNLVPGVVGLYSCGIYSSETDEALVETPATVVALPSTYGATVGMEIKSAAFATVTCDFGAGSSSNALTGEAYFLVREHGTDVPFSDQSLGVEAMILSPRLTFA